MQLRLIKIKNHLKVISEQNFIKVKKKMYLT